MSLTLISQYVLATVAAVLLSGCLMRHTVTSNGDVVQDNYVVKRPLKDAIGRSE